MGRDTQDHGTDGRGLAVMGKPREARRRLALAPATVAALALALLPAGTSARPAEVVPGPVAARVLRVIDGDTIEVAAKIWLGQELTVKVRLAGIDAPEMRGHCGRERTLARAARDLVVRAVGDTVRLTRIKRDKYGGRVVARVAAQGGHDLSKALLDAGLAHRYAGRRKLPWCQTASR